MRGESAKFGRMNYRRLITATTGASALAVAAIFALSSVASAGIAHPASFPGAYWSPSTFRENGGCAQAHAFPAHWTALTGDGKSHGSTSAKTCPAYRGGSSVNSYGDVDQELQVWAPVSLATGTGGVNVTWNIHDAASFSSGLTGSNYACPNSYYYSYHYNYGYTWFNYSYSDAYCEVGTFFTLGGYSEVKDLTTGTYYGASNYWDMYNDTYIENYSYSDVGTYSNSSYWAYNYSYGYSFNGTTSYQYPSTAVFSGTQTPTWFINGTFVSTDDYQVFTYVYGSQESVVEGFSGVGHAATSLNMATGANHEDLLPFQVW